MEGEDPTNSENYIFQLYITNYIVQAFIIQNADILICVVGMLTSSEQQFLNKIKKKNSVERKD